MASRMDKFRDTYANAPHLAKPMVVDPARVKGAAQVEEEGFGNVVEDVGSTIYNTVAPFLQGITGGLVGAQAGQIGASNEVAAAVAQEATQTPMFETLQNKEGTNQGVQTAAAAPLALGLAGLDFGESAVATGVGGTVMIGTGGLNEAYRQSAKIVGREDTFINPNPLFRDGIEFEDVTETYRRFWDDDITAGQAIATTVGRTGLNVVDFVMNGRAQEQVDEWVWEQTARQIYDPESGEPITEQQRRNLGQDRGDGLQLLGWNVGLYSGFDIYNERQRKSAYNQGVGRWVTGVSDAAIYWWLGPDVLVAKAAGKGFRTLFMQSYDSLADLNKMHDDLAAHSAFRAGRETGEVIDESGNVVRTVEAKQTPVGKLVESLTKLNEQQVLRHKIASTSNNAPLVARVFGKSTTDEGTALRLRAMAGDRSAVKQLFNEDKIAADALQVNMDRRDYLMDVIGRLDEQPKGATIDDADTMLRGKVTQLNDVLEEAKLENAELRDALTAFDAEALLPNSVRLDTISLSKLDFGPNSVARMDRKARDKADRAIGANFTVSEFKSGGNFGRVIRVFRTQGAKWKSFRQNGIVNLNDANDLLDEIDAALNTRFFRQLVSKYGDQARLPVLNRETGRVENQGMLLTEFKSKVYDELLAAKTAGERFLVIQRFNALVRKALQDGYELSDDRASEIVKRYQDQRDATVDQIREYGWVQEPDGSINVLPEMQSALAERAVVDDVSFLDTIFRIEQGSIFARSGKLGSGAYARFDAVWRPLVLLRLGYTQRNVAEGWLRELAAFGTIGGLKDRRASSDAIGAGEALAFYGSRVRDMGSSMAAIARRYNLNQGTKKKLEKRIRENMRVQRYRQQLADEAEEALRAKEAEEYDYAQRVWRETRQRMLESDREAAQIGEAVTWDEIDTEARGLITEWADTAEQVIIPVEYMEPVTAVTTKGVRRARVAYAFEDVEEAAQRELTAGDIPTQNILDPDAALASEIPGNPEYYNEFKPFLTQAQAQRMDELLADLTDEAYGELDSLAEEGFRNMARMQMTGGRMLFRIVDADDAGTGIYDRIWSPFDIKAEDLYNGNIVSTSRRDFAEGVQYVRAQTYGRSVDLRANADRELERLAKFEEGPTATESMTPQQNLDWEVNFAADILDMFDDEAARLALKAADDLPTVPKSRGEVLRSTQSRLREMQNELDELVAEDPDILSRYANSPDTPPARARALAVEIADAERRFENDLLEISALVDEINQDPEFAAAVATQLWVRNAPEETRKILEDAGMLADSDTLRRMVKAQSNRARNRDTLRDEYAIQRDEMVARAERVAPLLDEIGSDLRLFHGGSRVPNDTLLPDPKSAGDGGGAYRGVGFYMTRDSGIAGEYAVGPKGGEGAFFGRAVARDEEPVYYAIRMDETTAQQFMDLDEVVDNPQTEQYLEDLFEHMLRREAPDDDFNEAWIEIDEAVRHRYLDQAFTMDPFRNVRSEDVQINDYREEFIAFFRQRKIDEGVSPEEADYAAQMLWVNAAREVDGGVLGVRHLGGQNIGSRDHDVYIWYGDQYEELMLEPVESLSIRSVALQDVYNKIERLTVNIDEAQPVIERLRTYGRFDPAKFDLATMPGPVVERLGRAMSTNNGIGRFKVNDSNNPYGWTWMVNPESVVAGADNTLDSALPGKFVGEKLVEGKFRQFMGEASSRNPQVWSPGAMSEEQLLEQFNGNQAAVDFLMGRSDEELAKLQRQINDPAVMGPKGDIRAERALAKEKQDLALVDVINFMDEMGYTHVQRGKPDSTNMMSVAEMLGRSRTGAAYRARLDRSEIDDMTDFTLGNDPEFQKLRLEVEQLRQESVKQQDLIAETEQQAQEMSLRLESMLTVKQRGDRRKRQKGRGTESFTTREGGGFETDGLFNPNNEGEMIAQLTSADKRTTLDLFGYADREARNLRRTMEEMDYTPESPLYWQALSRQINRMYRNDPVAQAILSEGGIGVGMPLDEAAPFLDQIVLDLRKSERGRAWLRDVGGVEEFKDMVPHAQLSEDALEQGREIAYMIYQKLDLLGRKGGVNGQSSEQFLRRLAEKDVTPQWLKTQLGWRTDMPAIRDFSYVDPMDSRYRKVIGSLMRRLGTTPENRMVRHPFARARWRESMQRQADVLAEQKRAENPDWDGTFTDAEVNAMQRVAKTDAVKKTQQYLYSIQRLSTPAYTFRFLMPFFPAWASTMRFWLLRMPLEKPESIARYAMLFDTPESIGMVQDRRGQQVDEASQEGNGVPSLLERVGSKIGGSEDTNLVVQVSPGIAERLGPILGGQSTLKTTKGSLDMMLQGDYFFIPGFGPGVTIPAQWLGSRFPNIAARMEAGIFGTKNQDPDDPDIPYDPATERLVKQTVDTLTTAAFNSVIPFGVTKDKDATDIATRQAIPPWVDKFSQAFQMNTAAFSNTVNAVYRNQIIDWELNDRIGDEPNLFNAVNKSRQIFILRGLANLTLPFAPSFDSKYKFYVDEWRNGENETRDEYEQDPQAFQAKYGDDAAPYRVALDNFLDKYGEDFYAATKSLSGNSSGMGPNVGEYEAAQANQRLVGELAGIGDDGDASYVSILTRPFEDVLDQKAGYDQSIYAWQFDRPIKGASGKFYRESSKFRDDMLIDIDKELAWREYEQKLKQDGDLLEMQRLLSTDFMPGTEDARLKEQVTQMFGGASKTQILDFINYRKQQVAQEVGENYPVWLEDYNSGRSVRWLKASKAVETMLEDDSFMEYVGKFPEDSAPASYVRALQVWKQGRDELRAFITYQTEVNGESSSIDSKIGGFYEFAYMQVIEAAMAEDPYGNFANLYERYFASDRLIANGEVLKYGG